MSPTGEPQNHYFSASPESQSDERRVEVLLPDLAFTMYTDTGVFAHNKVDAGTQLLLSHSAIAPRLRPATPHGDKAGGPPVCLVDLGCGAGVITLTLAQRYPSAQIWAVDVNPRARELCARNAVALGLRNVVVKAPEEVPADLRVTAIWSNPPIRIGKEALHAMLDLWLDRVESGGEVWLVVNKHLGADSLQRWLTARKAPAERIASKAGYRILRITID